MAPRPVQQPPQQRFAQPQPAAGGMMSGIGSTIVTGMALGAGSEVGHQAVRAMMGSGSGHGSGEQVQQEQPQYAQQQQEV